MAGTAPQLHTMTTEEVRNISVDMSFFLDDGELLDGTPDVQCSADLTITNAQISTAAVLINGEQVAIGMAIQFTVEAPIVGRYTIELLCTTDAGQTVEGSIQLNVIRSRF